MTKRFFPPAIGGPDGAVLANVGRYHREAISTAFEMIGGIPALADWAENNKTDFYTKLYPRVIPKEVEIGASQGVEDLLRQLDAKTIDVTPHELETEDAS